MTLDSDTEQTVLDAVVQELVERAWAKVEGSLEDVTCFSISRLAGMLDLSTSQTRKVLEESIDFGPRDSRVTLAQAKRLLEKRTIRR